MNYVSSLEEKLELIHKRFSNLIGGEIRSYELAQIWIEEEQEWSNWMDIPLFLTIDDTTLSISWQKFDDLAIEFGRILPFPVGGSTIRWLSEDVKILDLIIGEKIVSVSLGASEMSIASKDIEIWTSLVILLSNGSSFEIFNALDENGVNLIPTENIKIAKTNRN
jgi:hypothetical protein